MKTGIHIAALSGRSRSKRGSACAFLGLFALAVSLNNALTLPPPVC